jgi:hypothetical protein
MAQSQYPGFIWNGYAYVPDPAYQQVQVPPPAPAYPPPGAYPPPAQPHVPAMPRAAGAPPPGLGAPGGGRASFGAPAGARRMLDGRNIAGANMAGTRNPYLLDGDYLLEILRTLVSGRKGSFVAEFQIHQSSNPDRAVGTKASWIQSMSDPDVAYPSIKRFIACACGVGSDAEVEALGIDFVELINACASDTEQASSVFPPNPLKARLVVARVAGILTRENKPFTRHDFHPYVT